MCVRSVSLDRKGVTSRPYRTLERRQQIPERAIRSPQNAT
jgi:hypothetical protein